MICSACHREYPIVDGIPMLVENLRELVTHGAFSLLLRDDLHADLWSLIADCIGPGTELDTLRQHVSHYTRGHWADLDPEDPTDASPVVDLVERATGLLAAGAPTRTLDLGCATGRASFELAGRTDGLVLGVDLHLGMLRVAARALRTGVVEYARRRTGLVYDLRRFEVPLDAADRVDFWFADATALPLSDGVAQRAVSLNVLDCIGDPLAHLNELARVLDDGGDAALCTPYDWSPAATAFAGWIGGHSQRGPDAGAPDVRLRMALGPDGPVRGLRIRDEVDRYPWSVRLHERSEVRYDVHLLALERASSA